MCVCVSAQAVLSLLVSANRTMWNAGVVSQRRLPRRKPKPKGKPAGGTARHLLARRKCRHPLTTFPHYGCFSLFLFQLLLSENFFSDIDAAMIHRWQIRGCAYSQNYFPKNPFGASYRRKHSHMLTKETVFTQMSHAS